MLLPLIEVQMGAQKFTLVNCTGVELKKADRIRFMPYFFQIVDEMHHIFNPHPPTGFVRIKLHEVGEVPKFKIDSTCLDGNRMLRKLLPVSGVIFGSAEQFIEHFNVVRQFVL